MQECGFHDLGHSFIEIFQTYWAYVQISYKVIRSIKDVRNAFVTAVCMLWPIMTLCGAGSARMAFMLCLGELPPAPIEQWKIKHDRFSYSS